MRLRWHATSYTGWVLCAAWLLGCHGVGRAIVGDKPPPAPGADICDRPVPICADEPLPPVPEFVPQAAQAVDLSACAPPSGTCLGAAQLPVNSAANGCQDHVASDADPAGSAALQTRICDRLHIVDDRLLLSERVLHVDAPRLELTNVVIESALPLTVELDSAELQHVWFDLQGPIILQIRDSKSFNDVRVSGAEKSERARLVLDRVRGQGLAVGTDAAQFAGQVAILRSTLASVRVRANALKMESVSLSNAVLMGEQLDGVDVTALRLAVSVYRTLLSASSVRGASFEDCGALTAVASDLQEVRITGCSEGARLYGTKLSSSSLDGLAILDKADLDQVRLGLHDAPDIAAWGSSFRYVRFCGSEQSISLGANSSAECTRCDGQPQHPREVSACVVGVDGFEVASSVPWFCKALIDPPLCEDPAPERMRPPF